MVADSFVRIIPMTKVLSQSLQDVSAKTMIVVDDEGQLYEQPLLPVSRSAFQPRVRADAEQFEEQLTRRPDIRAAYNRWASQEVWRKVSLGFTE